MRPHVRTFAEDVAALVTNGPVVEIGSRPAEGQHAIADLRSLFPGREYIGCDLQPGAGVDRIEDVHDLSFEDESVGAVLALDTLEHVADPRRAMKEIHRVLRPGGLVAISSVMFFVIHAHPWDYWRFTPEGFSLLLSDFDDRRVLAYGYEQMPDTIFGIGLKAEGSFGDDPLPATAQVCAGWGAGTSVDLGPMRMTVPQLWRLALRETLRVGRQGVRR